MDSTSSLFQPPTGVRIALAPHTFTPTIPTSGETASNSQKSLRQGVLKAMSVQLTDTYRKANPKRPEAADEPTRRTLTQPSVPKANG